MTKLQSRVSALIGTGLSVSQISKKTGASKTYVRKLEKEKQEFWKGQAIRKMADADKPEALALTAQAILIKAVQYTEKAASLRSAAEALVREGLIK